MLEGNHKKGTVVFGSDHAGFEYKELLKKAAQTWGYTVMDCGAHSAEAVDYPDFIIPVVKEVLAGAKGVLICGSGIGMSIGANRFEGIGAALCFDSLMAKFSRTHNNANILVLGERFIGIEEARSCLETFLNTPFEGEDRHVRRIEKLDKLTI
ncbi:MAG: ribose 5-phosphate isomerase B [Alphaproteobacteria bacterium GWC2_42_16]|nr:MAG: ribose 5-phosphate isomerase B [Alphaproteobacteria bacterium GWC2_42_16]OFW73922.1 MAG: ribose 5-phosphate isomerase B [Alphaproteobacteria bacterium GWA2_41_27]OFW82776.1 MAG: ribose 5-phosphate isomerase B [Alphaproteobacteria bacterium RIFCSPHIGHO2_12_FULL_42_100]OFW91050.1 MAG: ribose 5-phosphate isomerase B [Alphaproteobacteria bacterium RIFCSPHIGHO2_12_42_13]OFW91930.1 MAG: ribose 5-phosphate isomerase B [Alphaproteobacteria bacterium RIFCSPHIGHO2_02_FULL_42_30]OFX02556.1 MAG: r